MGATQVVLRKVDGAEILRRVDEHGVTLLCGAPAVVAAILDAAQAWDGPDPRSRPHADGRRRRAAADAHDRAHGDRARVGVHPDLRAHRDGAAADDQPAAAPSGTTCPRPSARSGSAAPAHPRSGCASTSTARARCWRGRTTCSRATGTSPRRRRRRSSTAGSTPATAGRSTTRATSRSRTARRT